MSESFSKGVNPENLRLQYETEQNVRSRFKLYEITLPLVDFESETISGLGLAGHETVVDVGTADGVFLDKIHVLGSHFGKLVGVEPYGRRNPLSDNVPVTEATRLALQTTLGIEQGEALFQGIKKRFSQPYSQHVEFVRGEAVALPFADDSADRLSAMFMLYHVLADKQSLAFAEFKRVLKPGGQFALATSGAGNKLRHRMFEHQIAWRLGVEAPNAMNSGFDASKAALVLPKHFTHVYAYHFNHAQIIIDGQNRLDMYLNSIRSLRDQCEPVPGENDFESMLKEVVVPQIEHEITVSGSFKDAVERSLFLASDVDFDPPMKLFGVDRLTASV